MQDSTLGSRQTEEGVFSSLMVTFGVLTIPAGFTDALLFGFVSFPDSFLKTRPKRPPIITVSTLLYVQRPLEQITNISTWDPRSVEGPAVCVSKTR